MSFLDRFKKKNLDREPDEATEDHPARVEPQFGQESAPWVRVDPETGEIHPEDVPAEQEKRAEAPKPEQGAAASNPASPPPFDPYGIGAAPFEMVPPAPEEPPSESEDEPASVKPEPAPVQAPESAPKPQAPAEKPQGSVRAEARTASDEVTKPVPRRELRAPRPVRGFSVGADMPSGPSEEELIARRRTKNRLVGAAILMAAVVVAAPFIMDDPQSVQAPPLETSIPDVPPQSAVQTTELALNAPAVPKAAGDVMVTESGLGKAGESVAKANLAQEARDSIKAQEAEKAAKAKEQPKAKTEKPAAVEPAAKAPEKPKAPIKTAGVQPPSGEGWYVQVMATSSERQAEGAVKRIAELGFPAYRVPVEKGAATLWRVRVGLYKNKKEAEGVVGAIVLNGIASKPYVAKQ